MVKKFLVIDPRKLDGRIQSPESLKPGEDFKLMEEVIGDSGRMRAHTEPTLEILDLDVDYNAVKRAATRSMSPTQTIRVGKALIDRKRINPRTGKPRVPEAVEVHVGRILDESDFSHELAGFKDEMALTVDVGGIVGPTFNALKALGYENPLLFLNDEDNNLSRVEIRGVRGEVAVGWDRMSSNEACLTRHVTENGETFVFDGRDAELAETTLDARAVRDVLGVVTPFAVVPLKHEDNVVGAFVVKSDEEFSVRNVQRLERLSDFISSNFMRVMNSGESAIKGLKDKTAYARYANDLFRRAIREDRPISVLMMDVDNLKELNGEYHHEAGSHFMNALGVLVSSELRDINTEKSENGPNPHLRAFSWSGTDEIVIVGLMSKEDAMEVARRLRSAIRARRRGPVSKEDEELAHEMDDVDKMKHRVLNPSERWSRWWRTASIGVASFPKDMLAEYETMKRREHGGVTEEDLTELRKSLRLRANDSLMQLKETGERDRIAAYTGIHVE